MELQSATLALTAIGVAVWMLVDKQELDKVITLHPHLPIPIPAPERGFFLLDTRQLKTLLRIILIFPIRANADHSQ